MDSVGSWTAYAASYNRLTNSGNFQNAASSSGSCDPDQGSNVSSALPAPNSSSLLLQPAHTSGLPGSSQSTFNPGGFLTPPPVAYEPVFTPLFHQKSPYPGLNVQSRPTKPTENEVYNSSFFDQSPASSTNNSWSSQPSSPQLPSPFGVLPHETVPPTTRSSENNCDSHFAATSSVNQINSQFSITSSYTDFRRFIQSPASSLKATNAFPPYYQTQPLQPAQENSSFKQIDYTNSSSIQQSCLIGPLQSTPSGLKDYRLPQFNKFNQNQITFGRDEWSLRMKARCYGGASSPGSAGGADGRLREPSDMFSVPEIRAEPESQSSPISYAMIDSQRSVPYQSTIPSNFQNYRYPVQADSEYYRAKPSDGFHASSSMISDYRRCSPLENSTVAPQPQAPLYPMYSSSMSSMLCSNPSQDLTYPKPNSEAPSRPSFGYSPMIPRTERVMQDTRVFDWDERNRKYNPFESLQRQTHYYCPDENPLSLQNLSSCRGDPMSLVKTLNNIRTSEDPNRRRAEENGSEFSDRVPPPAHHNTNLSGYYDYDRWNCKSSGYSTSSLGFSSPSSVGSSLVSPPPTAGSSLMSQPPTPYLDSSLHTEVSQGTPLMPSIPNTPQPSVNSPASVEPQKKLAPEILVPDIEEELDFLNDFEDVEETPKIVVKPAQQGFMSSYIKFISGDKEESKSPRPSQTRVEPVVSKTTSNLTPSPQVPAGDPQDDPRYFPLPKSSQDRTFDSSDCDSFDELFSSMNTKQQDLASSFTNLGLTSDSRRKVSQKSKQALSRRRPRKEKRKKSSAKVVDTASDSKDSDPPWCPVNTLKLLNDLEENSEKRRTRPKRKRKQDVENIIVSSDDEDDVPLIARAKKSTVSRRHRKKKDRTSHRKSVRRSSDSGLEMCYEDKKSQFPFKVGDFVISRSERTAINPTIWMVKEKPILQRFQYFAKDGLSYYSSLPLFTSWSPECKTVYESVPVRVLKRNDPRGESVVQLLTSPAYISHELRQALRIVDIDSSSYQDNFEVYIQTLFSQALDHKFLNEIFKDQDQYFMSNIVSIDGLRKNYRKRFVVKLNWSRDVVDGIAMWPNLRISSRNDSRACLCSTCLVPLQKVKLAGAPYFEDTLAPNVVISQSTQEIPVCSKCIKNVELLHSLSHQKLGLFLLCEQRVKERRKNHPTEDDTFVLNFLLADESWLSELFNQVKLLWAQIELVISELAERS